MTYHRILVPLDGSAFGEHALPHAVFAARGTGAALELVHVHHLPQVEWFTADAQWDEQIREAARRYLERQAERIGAQSGRPTAWQLLVGDPVHVLTDYVERTGADLVVMTTHGLGGLERAWIGSVADGLVRHAGCPVLLVRPPEDDGISPQPAAYGRILIPLDGSPLSERVLPHAAALATPGDSRVTLLRVVAPTLTFGERVFRPDEERLRDVAESARRELDAIADRLRADGLEVDARVVSDPSPAQVILDVADEEDVALIAMMMHGRGGVKRWLLGSTADKVLRSTRTPLLLYRPSD